MGWARRVVITLVEGGFAVVGWIGVFGFSGTSGAFSWSGCSFVQRVPFSRQCLHGGSRSFLPRKEHHFFACLHCVQLAIGFGGFTISFDLENGS